MTMLRAGADVVERQALDFHRRRPMGHDAQLDRGRIAQIENALGVERPAVVDAHDDLAAVVEVAHADVAGNG